jgi:hypothetical protein
MTWKKNKIWANLIQSFKLVTRKGNKIQVNKILMDKIKKNPNKKGLKIK